MQHTPLYQAHVDLGARMVDFGGWDMPLHYPSTLRKKARAHLDEGRKRAPGEDAYEKRVKMITQTFDLLEAFIEMMESRAEHDFVKAKAELVKMDETAEKLMTYAFGRGLDYYDMPTLRRIVRESSENDYRMQTVILGIVMSDPFLMRRAQ